MDLIVAHDRAELAKAREAITAKGRDLLTPRGRDHLTARDREGLTEEHVDGTVALVPTMGALHEGHRSLIRQARERADHVVVSVFVNPLQFGPNEDFSRYPRTFDADLEVCRAEGVQLVFAPAADEMYGPDRQVSVSAGQMGRIVEGAFRPGHFDGVLTIVLKLLHLVQPDVAVFGQKDAQQLALIRRMAADLDLPIEIVGGPTVREADGLALSSRNRYLSPEDRQNALALSRALFAGAEERAPSAVVRAARAVLDQVPIEVDYLALVDPATFTEVKDGYAGEAVLAVAARVGTTRLIDNVVLTLV
ncbi:pantoate--beta-alanine ligase [Streptosporangiaceae bacterium NEAU-GS5]|nr:pantoate--beta-alanine ligase [Streptosporangiaceae bacterium NEAU-GS5]